MSSTQFVTNSSPPAAPYTASSEGQAVFKQPLPRIHETDVNTHTPLPLPQSPLFAPPRLPHPDRTCNEYRLVGILQELHASGSSIQRCFTESLGQASERMKQISRENIEKLKEAAMRTKENGFWSLLQKIGECLLAAISTVLGITLVASGAGAIVGGVMIAAGILTIANFAMKESGSWDYVAKQLTSEKEKQEKLAFYIPLAVSLLTGVLGLGGSVASTIWSSLNITQQALTIVQAALGVYQGVTTIGKGVTQARVLWTQADLTKIDSDASLERISFERDSSLMGQILKKIEAAQQAAEQVIALAVQALRKTAIQA